LLQLPHNVKRAYIDIHNSMYLYFNKATRLQILTLCIHSNELTENFVKDLEIPDTVTHLRLILKDDDESQRTVADIASINFPIDFLVFPRNLKYLSIEADFALRVDIETILNNIPLDLIDIQLKLALNPERKQAIILNRSKLQTCQVHRITSLHGKEVDIAEPVSLWLHGNMKEVTLSGPLKPLLYQVEAKETTDLRFLSVNYRSNQSMNENLKKLVEKSISLDKLQVVVQKGIDFTLDEFKLPDSMKQLWIKGESGDGLDNSIVKVDTTNYPQLNVISLLDCKVDWNFIKLLPRGLQEIRISVPANSYPADVLKDVIIPHEDLALCIQYECLSLLHGCRMRDSVQLIVVRKYPIVELPVVATEKELHLLCTKWLTKQNSSSDKFVQIDSMKLKHRLDKYYNNKRAILSYVSLCIFCHEFRR